MAKPLPPNWRDSNPPFDAMVSRSDSEHMVLKLYVTGATGRPLRAIENIKAICDEYLEGHYDLDIVDLYEHPERALAEQVIAAPTLVKQSPLPVRRFIGDLSNTEKLLTGLNLPDEA